MSTPANTNRHSTKPGYLDKNAFIYGDGNEIYYLPTYGIVYDDVEIDNLQVSLDDLRKYKDKYHNDYKKIIEAIEREKQRERNPVVSAISKPEKKNKTSIWTIIAIVMVILYILYLLWLGSQPQS